ncbi:MAG: ABC transporter permease [Bacteroidales bacterium]|nr:ABC transporter permease [Bacteroidales bacterium]
MNNIVTGLKIVSTAFKNELNKIVSDSGALLILVLAVIAYPIIYSTAYKNNVLIDVPIAIVDLDHTQTSRTLSRMINETKQTQVFTKSNSLKEAEEAFWEGKVNGIILIPADFEKSIFKNEQTTVDVYCDAGYFLIYKETLNAAVKASGTLSAGIEIKRNIASGNTTKQAIERQNPLHPSFINLYNPSGAYGSFVMPGIIIVIIQQTLLIGIGMIGGAGREKNNKKLIEPGVMLQNGPFSVIIGKSLAYFLISMINIIFTLVWIYNWFGFPDMGNIFNVFLLLIPFIFAVIFLGLTISILLKKREYSILFLAFLSPIALFISGLSWPVSSMPKLLHTIAYIFPSTSVVPAYLRLRTMGVCLLDIKFELVFLIAQMFIYYFAACFTYKYLVKKNSLK